MVASETSDQTLVGKTLGQLRQMAQRLRLAGYSRLNKATLTEQLSRVTQHNRPPSDQSLDPKVSPAPEVTASDTPAAPQGESTSSITFLPKDPQWAYVFWDISSSDRQQALAAGAQQLCLRVADVTGLPLGASHPHTLQELVVDSGANEWYLPVPLSDRDYRVELGFRLPAAGWFPLAVSSVARVPSEGPSPVVSDLFVPFSLSEAPQPPAAIPTVSSGGVDHERFYQMATVASPRTRRVGSELLHELDSDQLAAAGLNDSGAGLWASGLSESGRGVDRQRSFWLVADAELIVYGATEPSASLFIGDEQVPLDADGTFRLQVPFRDGQQLYPIRAIAADGEQQRSIRLEFERSTPQAHVNTREQALAEWF